MADNRGWAAAVMIWFVLGLLIGAQIQADYRILHRNGVAPESANHAPVD